MKIKSVIMAIIICICHSLNIACAVASGITCTTEIDGNNVSISGQIPNTTTKKHITLLAGTTDNIIYIDQFESNEDGTFNYNFPIADKVPYGDYNLKIGSNSGYAPYEGILSYSAPSVMVRNKFIEADLTVALDWYVPQISGTISCTAGKTMTMTVVNKTDNTVIANDTMTSVNGVHNLSYTLPSLVSAKEYEVTFSCIEDSNSLAEVSVNIDSSMLAVDVTGTVNTADNVEVEARVQSTNTSLIDKSKTFTGSKTISETIPNLIPNASFNLTAQAYETVPEDTPQCEYLLNSVQDEESVIFINVNDIGILKNKSVVIEYDPTTLTLTDGCVLTPQKELSAVKLHNSGVEIVSATEGKIVFKFNKNADEGCKFSGTINGLKFKAKTPGEKLVRCKVTD